MPGRGLDDIADRVDAGAMAFDTRQMSAGGPPPIAVHDDGDVRGELLEVHLTRQGLVGRTWRNPGQELLKRHSGSFEVNRDCTTQGCAARLLDAVRAGQ